jgi:LacI family transcriptional regulator
LTTITQPLYDLGAVAMRMLTKLMNDESLEDKHIVLPYELIKKQSTLNK